MLWIRKRRRKVAVHTINNQTIEGFWCGQFRGHYVIEAPKIVEAEDRTHELQGRLEIPAKNVAFVQVLEA